MAFLIPAFVKKHILRRFVNEQLLRLYFSNIFNKTNEINKILSSTGILQNRPGLSIDWAHSIGVKNSFSIRLRPEGLDKSLRNFKNRYFRIFFVGHFHFSGTYPNKGTFIAPSNIIPIASQELQAGMKMLVKEIKKPYYPNFRNIFDYIGLE